MLWIEFGLSKSSLFAAGDRDIVGDVAAVTADATIWLIICCCSCVKIGVIDELSKDEDDSSAGVPVTFPLDRVSMT